MTSIEGPIPLNLLDLPLVFLQDQLLTTQAFAKAAEQRGVRLQPSHLEAFHQRGILVPLFRLRKPVRSAIAWARREGTSPAQELLFTSTDPSTLKEYRDEGYLHDPLREGFRPWSRYVRDFDGHQIPTSEFLYSPHQLLGIHGLRPLLTRMVARRNSRGQIKHRLAPRSFAQPSAALASSREVVVLSALARHYQPKVLRRATIPQGGVEELERFESEFDVREALAWLREDADRLRQQAEAMLAVAHTVDPLADWLDLSRAVRPRKWERLNGLARAAIDYRVAAEMLLLFHEDLAAAGVAAPLEPVSDRWWEPRHDRLSGGSEDVDEVLTDFGLSPHPAVLLILEGKTEIRIVPRVMELLGIPRSRTFIQPLDARGVDANLDALIAYAVTPAVGRDLPSGVLLARPPTNVLVVLDAERSFATEVLRERRRQHWIDRIMSPLDEKYQTPAIRHQVDSMVQTDTWNGQVFELAHFTDHQIAGAVNRRLLRLGHRHAMISRKDVAAVRSSPHPNIGHLWKNFRPPRLSKPDLADELWPTLRRRLNTATEKGTLDRIPVARVLRRAVNLAVMVPRGNVMLSNEEPLERDPDAVD